MWYFVAGICRYCIYDARLCFIARRKGIFEAFTAASKILVASLNISQFNKTIEDRGINVAFWIIKVHTLKDLGIIKLSWIIKVHTFI